MTADPPTKPSDLHCEAARVCNHHRHLLISLTPKANTHFNMPRMADGTVVKVCKKPVLEDLCRSGFYDEHNF